MLTVTQRKKIQALLSMIILLDDSPFVDFIDEEFVKKEIDKILEEKGK